MALPLRSEVREQDTWDLRPLYRSIEAAQDHLKALEKELPGLVQFQGKLGESAASLKTATEKLVSLSRGVEKLYTFAQHLSDSDTTNGDSLALLDQAQNLYARFAAQMSFFNPELLALDPKKLDALLKDATLQPYRRMLGEIVRYREHTLSTSEENLLAQATEVFQTCERVFSQLNNADFSFGTVPVEGKDVELTHGSFIVFLQNRDRAVREKAYFQYYSVFESHRHGLAAALAGSIKGDAYIARVRNYESALRQGLFGDNVEESVYENLVSTVDSHLHHLHGYHDRRREILGVEKLELFDTYVPLVPDVETHIPYGEACAHLIEAFRPLGPEYVDWLARGLRDERWVDIYENKGKRSGAYSGGCYDSYPYMLMNYKENNLSDLFTLAHEAGHSMHSAFSRKQQPYQDHGYTIFVAEVASTFNEQLLLSHLRKVYASNDSMMKFLADHQIEEIKRTLYRQTMFAEFEKETHALVEANEPVTVDVFTEVYGKILRRYCGPKMEIRDVSNLECLRIPHFYSAFYVYKYATGLSAAIALADGVLKGGHVERDRYLNFLRSGCTKYPIELLRDAGVDMAKPQPIKTALELFGRLTSEI